MPNDLPFPKPAWPPIQALDSVEIVGKRRDGGVDLAIVASQPIDDSPETIHAIRQKVATYLAVIELEEFQAEMDYPSRDTMTIVIHCDHAVHPAAHQVIEECRLQATAAGVRLVLRSSVEDQD